MGLFDLVLGNIIGSNALNMMIFVFMDWLWSKPPLWKYLTFQNLILAGVAVFNMLLLAGSWGNYKKKPGWAKPVGTLLILLLSLFGYILLYFSIHFSSAWMLPLSFARRGLG